MHNATHLQTFFRPARSFASSVASLAAAGTANRHSVRWVTNSVNTLDSIVSDPDYRHMNASRYSCAGPDDLWLLALHLAVQRPPRPSQRCRSILRSSTNARYALVEKARVLIAHARFNHFWIPTSTSDSRMLLGRLEEPRPKQRQPEKCCENDAACASRQNETTNFQSIPVDRFSGRVFRHDVKGSCWEGSATS